MKFSLKNIFSLFSQVFKRFNPELYHCKKRPKKYSKNAWSYIAKGKATPATALYAHIGAL
ncbi:hypothetical protein HYE59_07555 [Aggregatibacter actinomycetemcomitans]|uniref:hypothetical protein n=1 Tax=Aggregatibacter actinomycetemcomitans TaxID=714 RepID=UPI00197C767E|nr:hypothetical protein [Aggregatibacter actinomycetemcomitans]MBN6077388.1 hypothetical protein [Aggregatibacter actinomycetemcomitans]